MDHESLVALQSMKNLCSTGHILVTVLDELANQYIVDIKREQSLDLQEMPF